MRRILLVLLCLLAGVEAPAFAQIPIPLPVTVGGTVTVTGTVTANCVYSSGTFITQDVADGTPGAAVGTKATMIGGTDGATLRTILVDSSGRVAVNLATVGGVAVSLGAKVSASSIPVVIASDQASVAVTWSTSLPVANLPTADTIIVSNQVVAPASTGLIANLTPVVGKIYNVKIIVLVTNLFSGADDNNMLFQNNSVNVIGRLLYKTTSGAAYTVEIDRITANGQFQIRAISAGGSSAVYNATIMATQLN